jgi:hypothetical protein
MIKIPGNDYDRLVLLFITATQKTLIEFARAEAAVTELEGSDVSYLGDRKDRGLLPEK